MFFKISWDEDFDTLMMFLWSKYGKDLFTLDGIGKQMDLNEFSRSFFNNKRSTADVSIDPNANVVAKTGIEYNFEMPKPLKRYNSYFLIWKELKKNYGLQVANEIVESQLTGDIYINDFSSIAEPYCFNYSTYDITCNGLEGLNARLKIFPPKSLATFFRQVEQFTAVAANSTLGATGLADLLLVASKFVDMIYKNGRDGHIIVTDIETYVREQLTSLIYTLNWSFRGAQSPFTNISVYDDTFLDSLCPDYGATKETVKMLQRIYVGVMNTEMRRTPLTFPVTTACFAIDEHKEIKDKDFLKFIAEANKEFGFINLYNGNKATLSSCCRLRSERKSEYFNSFGAGSTKIGCYDDKTEVLASNGWKYFKDVNMAADKIFTMNDNRSVQFDTPTYYHEYDYCGDMIRFATKTVDLLVTPNHRMVKRNVRSEQLVFERANVLFEKHEFSIPIHDGIVIDHYDEFFEIPEYVIENRTYPALRIPYTTWAKFMGIYLSEGSCDPEGNKNNHGGERYRITISQSKVNASNCCKIEELLDEIGIPYGYYGVNYELHHKPLCLYLRKFGNKYSKFIPADLKNQPKEVLEVLWEWLLMGDGYTAKNGVEMYWSTSKQLISDIQDVLARMGYTSGYSSTVKDSITKDGRIIKATHSCYRLVKYTKRNSIIRKTHGHMGREPYRGKVYCLTVPNGRLFVRRNGKTCWSGNSLGVVTTNLPRAAKRANGDYDKFIEILHSLFIKAQRINGCKRRIVKKRIELGAAPLYSNNYMELSKQYSTFGIVGLNEALQLLGYDILSEEGQKIALDILRWINIWITEAEKVEKAPHNCEQVPAESSAVKLAQKDKYLNMGIDLPLYSNQFIPLTTKADMHDRLRLQGMFDSKLSGGAIAHINVGEPIQNTDTMVSLMEYAAKCGVVYWAINYRLNCCKSRHTWVGTEICPTCGEHWDSQITRVVGFFTTVKNWNPVRREKDWPNRQFYKEEDL